MTLLEYFQEAITTTADVDKLKTLILELGLKGKLVKQEPSDEKAYDLLSKIEIEKKRLVQEKIIKQIKLKPVTKEEIPYSIPNSWAWVRLGDAFDVRDGTHDTPKYLREGIPLVTSKNISQGKISLENVKYISKEDHEKISLRSNVEQGDILFAMIGSIGNPVIVNFEPNFSVKNVALFKYYSKDHSEPEFLFYYLLYAENVMKQQSSGAVQSFVSLNYLRNFLIPLPPIAEQRRIVVAIKELLEKCEELSLKLVKMRTASTLLNESVFTRLQEHSSTEQMKDLQFVIKNIENLCNDRESINQLRNAILSLAVQGKLEDQNGNEEPASVLVEEIKKEKERMITEKIIRREKPLQPISSEEVPFSLPDGWEWVRLGEITTKLGAGKTPLGGEKNYVQEGVKFIRSQNVWNGGLLLRGVAHIPSETNESMRGSIVRPKDILLNITGASIGRSSLVPDDFDMANVNQHVSIIRLVDDRIRHYIHTCIISPYFQNEVMRVQVGASREGLSMAKLAKFIIPLPPIAEQTRIMDKVQSLFDLIGHYEKQVIIKEKSIKSLSDSLIENFIN